MGFWNRYYRPDLFGWKVTRINDPAVGHTPQKNIIWLASEPTGLDKTGMFYMEYDPSLLPKINFTTNLPGNNASDTVATYVQQGAAKTFTVAVNGGIAPYTYAWFRRSGGVDNAVGTNSPTYSIAAYASGNNGDYFCRVTDAAGQVVESARERTKVAIRLSTNLAATATWTVGTSASLAVVVDTGSGLAPYTYAWYKGGVVIAGQTAATLTIASPAAGDAGTYYCIATSSNTTAPRTVQSTSCVVTVNPAA